MQHPFEIFKTSKESYCNVTKLLLQHREITTATCNIRGEHLPDRGLPRRTGRGEHAIVPDLTPLAAAARRRAARVVAFGRALLHRCSRTRCRKPLLPAALGGDAPLGRATEGHCL